MNPIVVLVSGSISAMSNVKVSPVVPAPKRSHGFSIESIMRKEEIRGPSSSGDDSDSGDDRPLTASPQSVETQARAFGSRIPPLHPALPVHVQQLLFSDATGRRNQELLSQRSHELVFGNPQMNLLANGLRPGLPLLGFPSQFGANPGSIPSPSAFHPGLLAASLASGRDPSTMIPPWFLNKTAHPSMLNYPYGMYPKQYLIDSSSS